MKYHFNTMSQKGRYVSNKESYVTLGKVFHTKKVSNIQEGLSHEGKYVTLGKVCQTKKGMSN